MSSFALPARPQAANQSRTNNKSNNNTANPLREHVNVYSVRQNSNNGGGGGGGGGKGGKVQGRVGGYTSKEDAELLAAMGGIGLGLKVNYPASAPVSPSAQYAAHLPSPVLLPQDAMAYLQLQQAQIGAAAGNPQLQAYLAMQASAQRANLFAHLQLQQQAQLSALSRPTSAHTTPQMVDLASPTLPTPSTFMPPPPVPAPRTTAKADRSAFAAQVQARTKAREAAAAAAAGHTRSASVSSSGSAKADSTTDTSSKPPTPIIRITPAMPSQPQFGGSLGLGRPASTGASPRLASSPSLGSSPRIPDTARSVSLPIPTSAGGTGVRVVRQPSGPPAPAAELGDRNFQSCIRKKAGLKLGVLGRRVEGISAEA